MFTRAAPTSLVLILVFGLGAGAGFLAAQGPAPSQARETRPNETRSVEIPAAGTRQALAGAYWARILNVIDGDTVEARVHVWMGQEVVTRVRIRDIDAPEPSGACAAERDLAREARARLIALAGEGRVILSDVGPDKYFGRVVGRIILPDGRDAGRLMLDAGLARPYRGGRRGGWCEPALNR